MKWEWVESGLVWWGLQGERGDCYTPNMEKIQKRKAESALVDMMRWIILFSCFSFLFSVFIILLPFASAYARVGNVMMFCMLRLGFFFAFTFFLLLLLLLLLLSLLLYKFIQFLLHSGITKHRRKFSFFSFFLMLLRLRIFPFPLSSSSFYSYCLFRIEGRGRGRGRKEKTFYTFHFCWQFFHHQCFKRTEK